MEFYGLSENDLQKLFKLEVVEFLSKLQIWEFPAQDDKF